MASTFGGYNIAYSGMYANQSALTVTSQNLSNVNTAGYSRQQIATSEVLVATSSQTTVSSGVAVSEVTRARNQLLDSSYRGYNADSSYWSTKSGMLEYAQEILDEFSANDGSGSDGLQTTIQKFFDSWETLSTSSDSQTARQEVVEYATALLDTLTDIDDQLAELQQDACNSARDIVADINNIAEQVAALNIQIVKAEAANAEASDLRDQRDYLLDQLSAYTNFSTQEQDNGSVTVFIGGTTLVNYDNTHEVSITGDGSTDKPLTILWRETGEMLKITTGTLKACLEDADQTGIETITDVDTYDFTTGAVSSISNVRQALNALTTTIAVKVNEIHSSGTDLEGNAGADFFVVIDADKTLSISNIQVNPDIVNNLDKLVTGTTGQSGDNTIAVAIADLSNAALYSFAGVSEDSDDFYASIISWLGTEGSTASAQYDTASTLTTQVDNQRQSISSVSMDEEMSNMIMYQNAYGASARVLSVMDGLVASLIEEIG